MPEITDDTDNGARAERVADCIEKYLVANFFNAGDQDLFREADEMQLITVIGDMISDLAHYVDSRGGDGADAISAGERHHDAETTWYLKLINGQRVEMHGHSETAVREKLPEDLTDLDIDEIEWGGY